MIKVWRGGGGSGGQKEVLRQLGHIRAVRGDFTSSPRELGRRRSPTSRLHKPGMDYHKQLSLMEQIVVTVNNLEAAGR
jgi:hypothetical protein